MRQFRFHLASLFASALTAALLLGVNVVPCIADHSESTAVDMLSCWAPPLRQLEIPDTQRHSAVVRVSQGWPFTVREESAFVRVATPIPKESNLKEYSISLTHWTWTDGVALDWSRVALNGVALFFATITILVCVEWFIRRRVSKLETGQ